MTDDETLYAVRVGESAEDTFDFEAWLSGARPPERSVTVYGRADLVADLEALNAAYEAEREGSTDRRLGGTGSGLAAQIRDLRAELESSRLTVRVRGLPREDILDMAKAKDATEVDLAVRQVAAGSVYPTMNEAAARTLLERIGWGQFRSIADAVWDASTNKQVTAPFSRAISDGTTE